MSLDNYAYTIILPSEEKIRINLVDRTLSCSEELWTRFKKLPDDTTIAVSYRTAEGLQRKIMKIGILGEEITDILNALNSVEEKPRYRLVED